MSDLQIAGDGDFYSITEAADTPGSDLEVDFTGIDTFDWIRIIALYNGGDTHAVAIQLYNYDTTTWDTFDSLQNGQEDVSTAGEYILENHSFFVPDDDNYISGSTVLVRFHHTMLGNAAHNLYIDTVELYKSRYALD